MLQLTIDERTISVQEGSTILEACRENDIPIPTLCYHPALEPYGGCRLCMVEINHPGRPSRLVASCAYPCEDGLVVQTASPIVLNSRRVTVELLLAGAWTSPQILDLANELGVNQIRYRLPESDNCILCGLCVRACREIVGVSAISLIGRGIEKKVSPPFEITAADCIGCGTCTLICPTEAIRLEDVTGFECSVSVHGLQIDDPFRDCRLCGDRDLRGKFSANLDFLLVSHKNS